MIRAKKNKRPRGLWVLADSPRPQQPNRLRMMNMIQQDGASICFAFTTEELAIAGKAATDAEITTKMYPVFIEIIQFQAGITQYYLDGTIDVLGLDTDLFPVTYKGYQHLGEVGREKRVLMARLAALMTPAELLSRVPDGPSTATVALCSKLLEKSLAETN